MLIQSIAQINSVFDVSVETHGMNLNQPQNNAIFNFMVSKGYKLISHCFVTSFFLRQFD